MLLLPSLPGGFGRPSGQAPNHPLGGRKGLQGEGGELLPVVCYQIVPKLLKWRSSQSQRQKTQTRNAPPLNKE